MCVCVSVWVWVWVWVYARLCIYASDSLGLCFRWLRAQERFFSTVFSEPIWPRLVQRERERERERERHAAAAEAPGKHAQSQCPSIYILLYILY